MVRVTRRAYAAPKAPPHHSPRPLAKNIIGPPRVGEQRSAHKCAIGEVQMEHRCTKWWCTGCQNRVQIVVLALRCIRRAAGGDDAQMRCVRDCGAVPALSALLAHPVTTVHRQCVACSRAWPPVANYSTCQPAHVLLLPANVHSWRVSGARCNHPDSP